MNCYFCQRLTTARPAVAICQSCGAACCLDHLEERTHPGRGHGLQPMLAPRVEIFCQRCMELQGSLLSGIRRSAARRVNASSEVPSDTAAALPDAREAVCAVEDLLGLQRSPVADKYGTRGWRRFFSRWRAR